MDTLRIITGRSRRDLEWKIVETTWDKLARRLASPVRTPETFEQYRKMDRAAKVNVKDVGGFVGGTLLRDGEARKNRNLDSRTLVALDVDNAREGSFQAICEALSGWEYVVHSTHSHSGAAPRFRVFLPLSREVTPEEYSPISRRVGEKIGLGLLDPSTFEAIRMMFWPSVSSDSEYVYARGEGSPVDADAVLASYVDWTDAAEWPGVTSALRGAAARRAVGGGRVQDPDSKGGVVGAWCRAHPMEALLEGELAGEYRRCGHGRYTYTGGHTHGGATLIEGKWLYSFHGTDPAGGKLCNSWDLYRIHRFGHLDAAVSSGGYGEAFGNRLPSYKAMTEEAMRDPVVKSILAREKAAATEEAFRDVPETRAEEEAKPEAPAEAPRADWTSTADIRNGGAWLPTPHNFRIILENDPRVTGCAVRDTFAQRDRVARDVPWRRAGDRGFWDDRDDAGLMDFMSENYDIHSNKEAMLGALNLVLSKTATHPVRNYLDSLVWDGTERLDTMLTDYLGATDSKFTRSATRKFFVAAVARVMEPGCKFDNVLTLAGPEGIGKSTLLATMGGPWFNDTPIPVGERDAPELLQGSWIHEMGELANYRRGDSEAHKAFISSREDQTRLAFTRRKTYFPRQCVLAATTNEEVFLKGDTGNRRFWVVKLMKTAPRLSVFDDLPAARDQLWAEAAWRYRQGEALFLPKDVEEEARSVAATAEETAASEMAGLIEDFVRLEIPENWDQYTLEERRRYVRYRELSARVEGMLYYTTRDGVPTMRAVRKTRRTSVCAVEVYCELMCRDWQKGCSPYELRPIKRILRQMLGEPTGMPRLPLYGRQQSFSVDRTLFEDDGEAAK